MRFSNRGIETTVLEGEFDTNKGRGYILEELKLRSQRSKNEAARSRSRARGMKMRFGVKVSR